MPLPKELFDMYALPFNRSEAIQILAAGLRSLPQAVNLINFTALPGINRLALHPVRVQAAATGVMAPALRPLQGIARPTGATARGPGALGLVVTAAMVLEDARRNRQEHELLKVAARFGLDTKIDADMLAAEAYLWVQYYGPWVFLRLPNDPRALDQVGQALMWHERQFPTTLRRSGSGDLQAVGEVRGVVDQALLGLGVVSLDTVMTRTSSVHPKLSTDSSRCRTLLGLTTPDWRAHHLIPFAVVASLPSNVQLAFVKAGWQMDDVRNLMALPANLVLYNSLPAPKAPVHNSAHTRYSRDVTAFLAASVVPAALANSPTLLNQLRATETTFRTRLLTMLRVGAGGYHPVLP